MADWLKVRHSLVRSAKIRVMARALKCNKFTALGLALTWLCWVDEQTEDGQTHLTPDELADELGFRGCAEALCSIGWAALGEDGCVVALDFGKHCGATAKKRAEDARRQSLSRDRRDKCHTFSVTNVTENALPEKKRSNNEEGCRLSEACMEPELPPTALPLPAGKEWEDWLNRLCEASGLFARNRRDAEGLLMLPPEVLTAAAAAFRALPSAAEEAELLGAYMRAKAEWMPNGKERWYRPRSQAMFFSGLGDWLAKAASWAKFAGWRPAAASAAARKRAKTQASAAELPEEVREAQHERQMQEWERIKQGSDAQGGTGQ